jgi:predicted NAD/FAD-binding protein
MKVAVVGAGIAGLSCAYELSRQGSPVEATLFEAQDYFGGHTNTVDVALDGVTHGVDTGFLVFNERTYPNLLKLFAELEVPSVASDMSFSVMLTEQRLEWAGSNLNTVFSQRRNLCNPVFLHMLVDILRIRFCHNHGLLQVNDRPRWYTVKGGAREYVRRMLPKIRQARCNAAVLEIERSTRHGRPAVAVYTAAGVEWFDHVVLAAHSDQSMRMLRDASDAERAGLRVVERFAFGQDYARTLREWRDAFRVRLPEVRAQGFDERFIRTWDFYLCYCEAAFTEANTDVVQFTLEHA